MSLSTTVLKNTLWMPFRVLENSKFINPLLPFSGQCESAGYASNAAQCLPCWLPARARSGGSRDSQCSSVLFSATRDPKKKSALYIAS